MAEVAAPREKLHGRAFYESIGKPRVVLAPMVDQSEYAWRVLTRSFFPEDSKKSLLAYTPMFHARLFAKESKYRSSAFEPIKGPLAAPPSEETPLEYADAKLRLDGAPKTDRPLFVQFCANDPDELLAAARYVQPFCDAVDLNLGCPQGIAKKGHYGAFLQEDWDLIYRLINKLHTNLAIPVTAKMRILETKEQTLEYARMILSAGASIITVHGRRREQKGHLTGVADWTVIRYLRENLPAETVLFANGNILQHEDIDACLAATGADAIMSAEGNLYDPSIFAKPPADNEPDPCYWRGRNGKGGFRMDAVLRRYLDIIYSHVLEIQVPERKPLFKAGDTVPESQKDEDDAHQGEGPPRKRQKSEKKVQKTSSSNLAAMQPHLFHMLRPLVSKHTHVRDALAKARAGDMAEFERVLALVEEVVAQGICEYDANPEFQSDDMSKDLAGKPIDLSNVTESSMATVARCRRPWFICQPYVRPLPHEALQKGAISLSKKEKARLQASNTATKDSATEQEALVETHQIVDAHKKETVQVPKQGIVCG